MMNSDFKSKLKSGEVLHGSWLTLGSAVAAEIMGQIGYDWLLIDLEHGAGNDQVMYQQLQALSGSEAVAIVRTEELSRPKVQRIMDAGAQGIMFPQIRNLDEATLAGKSMYYPPKGIRGMAPRVRASAYSKNFDTYSASLDQLLICVIQIENLSSIENIESIAQLEEVDVLFLGPNDLSLAMGIFGQFNHPEYQKALKRIAEVSKKYRKVAGVLLQNINEYEMYRAHGYTFIASSSDSAFLANGADETLRKMKEGRK